MGPLLQLCYALVLCPIIAPIPLQGLEEVPVKDATEAFELLNAAIRKRRVAETLMNKASSRSHSIFTGLLLLCIIFLQQLSNRSWSMRCLSTAQAAQVLLRHFA